MEDVISGGAAQKGGLKKGDVIQGMNGIEIKTAPEFHEQLGKYRPGPQAGNPGLQGVARTDRAPFRRGILQGAGSCRRIYPTTIKYR